MSDKGQYLRGIIYLHPIKYQGRNGKALPPFICHVLFSPVGLPAPKPRNVIPKIITYQRKRANRRILNEPEFMNMLKEFGELQVGIVTNTLTPLPKGRQSHRRGPFSSFRTSTSHPYAAPSCAPPPDHKVVEYNETSSLHEPLRQMQKTGVYISVHTSNLANAPLLQPGSAVFEIIQVSPCRESNTERLLLDEWPLLGGNI